LISLCRSYFCGRHRRRRRMPVDLPTPERGSRRVSPRRRPRLARCPCSYTSSCHHQVYRWCSMRLATRPFGAAKANVPRAAVVIVVVVPCPADRAPQSLPRAGTIRRARANRRHCCFRVYDDAGPVLAPPHRAYPYCTVSSDSFTCVEVTRCRIDGQYRYRHCNLCYVSRPFNRISFTISCSMLLEVPSRWTAKVQT
jgi:hypothetical protein